MEDNFPSLRPGLSADDEVLMLTRTSCAQLDLRLLFCIFFFFFVWTIGLENVAIFLLLSLLGLSVQFSSSRRDELWIARYVGKPKISSRFGDIKMTKSLSWR